MNINIDHTLLVNSLCISDLQVLKEAINWRLQVLECLTAPHSFIANIIDSNDPYAKIKAIREFRVQHPNLSLRDAKEKIEKAVEVYQKQKKNNPNVD